MLLVPAAEDLLYASTPAQSRTEPGVKLAITKAAFKAEGFDVAFVPSHLFTPLLQANQSVQQESSSYVSWPVDIDTTQSNVLETLRDMLKKREII